MSECVVRMEMPHVCITDNGYYGYCPMDRVWCIQRNAPPDITMREAYEAMTDKIPSWCPIICQLPDGHGRLVDADKEIDFHINDFERVKTEGIDVHIKAYSLSDLCDGITYAYDNANIIVPAEAERRET